MAGYRPIYKHIWRDPDFQDLNSDDKLMFIYLCTNDAVTESGIYAVTPKTISKDTGLDIDYISKRLNNGFHKNVVYDNQNRCVFIRKMRKYSTGGRPDLIQKSIISEYNLFKVTVLWQDFIKEYPEFEPLLNGCSTVVQPTVTVNDTLHVTVNDTLNNNGDSKKYPPQYIDFRKQVFAGLKERRVTYTSKQPAAEAGAINKMLKAGHTPESILKAYDLLKAQPFWQDKNLSLMKVNVEIDEVLKHGAYRGNNPPRALPKQYTKPEDL